MLDEIIIIIKDNNLLYEMMNENKSCDVELFLPDDGVCLTLCRRGFEIKNERQRFVYRYGLAKHKFNFLYKNNEDGFARGYYHFEDQYASVNYLRWKSMPLGPECVLFNDITDEIKDCLLQEHLIFIFLSI